MPDDATLRDVTVEPNPTPVTPEPAAAAPPPPVPDVVDKEALEIGRIMLDSGYSKDKVNQVLEAPAALNSLRYLINNNPQEFLNLLERTDPATGEKFLENMADTYVKRYAPKDGAAPAAGKDKNASDQLMSQIASLKEEVNGFRTAQQQRDNAAAVAQIKARYDARVDDLLAQVPKDMGLTKTEIRAMRAQLNEELGSDQSIVQRVSSGNFVDVPHKFKTIVENWAGDRKAATEAAKTAREGTSRNAFADLSSGPQPFMTDIPKGAADSWDNTEDAFAAALEKASR